MAVRDEVDVTGEMWATAREAGALPSRWGEARCGGLASATWDGEESWSPPTNFCVVLDACRALRSAAFMRPVSSPGGSG